MLLRRRFAVVGAVAGEQHGQRKDRDYLRHGSPYEVTRRGLSQRKRTRPAPEAKAREAPADSSTRVELCPSTPTRRTSPPTSPSGTREGFAADRQTSRARARTKRNDRIRGVGPHLNCRDPSW